MDWKIGGGSSGEEGGGITNIRLSQYINFNYYIL